MLPPESSDVSSAAPGARPLARRALLAFLLMFIASRVLVIGIMSNTVPDLFLHAGGTHVHHLNYGIFLLSAVGATLLFRRLSDQGLRRAAWAYGAGMALTFDEFGMWLHLGGSYWQRASYDAVIVVATLLGLMAFFPHRHRWSERHWMSYGLAAAAAFAFGAVLLGSLRYADRRLGPSLLQLEEDGPQ